MLVRPRWSARQIIFAEDCCCCLKKQQDQNDDDIVTGVNRIRWVARQYQYRSTGFPMTV
jgi:hypothetical protein